MHARRTLGAIAAATLVAGAGVIAQSGNPLNANSKNVLTLAVYGDSPYGTSPTDTLQTDKTAAFILTITPGANASAGPTAFGPFTWQRVRPSLP